jgi:hypothetical protein
MGNLPNRVGVTATALLLMVVIGSTHGKLVPALSRSIPVTAPSNQKIKSVPGVRAQIDRFAPPISATQSVWEPGVTIEIRSTPHQPIQRVSINPLVEDAAGTEISDALASEPASTQYPPSPASKPVTAADTEGETASVKGIRLEMPVALHLHAVSATSVHIGWEPTQGADGYNLYLCEDKITHWLDCHSVDVETNQAELAGLKPDSRYRLDIVAFARDGSESESSEVLFLETLAPDSAAVDIPPPERTAALDLNSACYHDCANMFAAMTHKKVDFDLKACRQRCGL